MVLAGALQLRLHLADLGLEPVDGLGELVDAHLEVLKPQMTSLETCHTSWLILEAPTH